VLAGDFIESGIKFAKERKKVVDIYLEHVFLTEEQPRFRYYPIYGVEDLSSLLVRWTWCLRREKQHCPFSNVRFHYVDTRIMGGVVSAKLVDAALLSHSMFTSAEYITEWQRVVTSEGMAKLIRLDKQLAAIRDDTLRLALTKYWQSKVVDNIEWLKQATFDTWRSREGRTRLNHAFLSVMDCYAIGRILRSFAKTARYSEDPTYIIGYFGEAHRERYEDFFMNWVSGFDMIFKKSEVAEGRESGYMPPGTMHRCLDVPGFTWSMAFGLD